MLYRYEHQIYENKLRKIILCFFTTCYFMIINFLYFAKKTRFIEIKNSLFKDITRLVNSIINNNND